MIELLGRVCTVSVATVDIVGDLDLWTGIDPDEGLEFTEEFLASILEASASAAAGNTIPAEEVYRRLGLD